ncbi:MAG: lysine--tRNA ligase [Elusimicrobiaceae bacterium]|nr:lysine--tRNA ligase [Elusimicrobiaceae bacterium]
METNTLTEIITRRYEEIRELRAEGTDPFPPRFEVTHTAAEALETAEESGVICAGRLVQLRVMGKAAFAHVQDMSGRVQLYIARDILGEAPYGFFKKHIHVGDFIGVAGSVFKTKTGEKTIKAEKLTLLSKAVRPMPEKWHGLQDTEIRFRSRHLDLIANDDVRRIFEARSKIVRAVRNTLDNEGFLEVETPILCHSAGGAAATPFETFHNALSMPLFMRIATELYLKRLIIGGMERVYEIGKIFRNEGIDTTHNPEFTMLEAYQAYTDYNGMARLFEAIIEACTKSLGITEVEYKGRQIRLVPPFRRVFLPQLWKQHCGEDIHDILDGKRFNRPRLLALAKKLGVGDADTLASAKAFERIFDEKILSTFTEPCFVMDHPTAITPLAKNKPGDETLVERFEFYAGGAELANAYTELNDPDDQLARLQEQARQRQDEKNAEVDTIDKDFVEAMESGMPPTGGIGIGIDRLTMLLTGKAAIREVVLFPTLKADMK